MNQKCAYALFLIYKAVRVQGPESLISTPSLTGLRKSLQQRIVTYDVIAMTSNETCMFLSERRIRMLYLR